VRWHLQLGSLGLTSRAFCAGANSNSGLPRANGIVDVRDDPFRPGGRPRLSSPRHVLFYRVDKGERQLTVLRILHDAMEPQRHISES
jgi:hypothetical protein